MCNIQICDSTYRSAMRSPINTWPNYQDLQSDLMQAAGDYGSNGLGQPHTGCTERSAWDKMCICKAVTCMGRPRATY